MSTKSSKKSPLYYDAFLVRIWVDNGATDWRATVEHVHKNERQTFTAVEQLLAFVQEQADLSSMGLDNE